MTWNSQRERRALAARVRRRLDALGWTQSELAKAAAVSRPFVSELLDGESKSWPGADRCIRMAHALRCSLHWLLTGQGQESDPTISIAQQVIDAYQQALTDVRAKLDELKPEG